MDGGERVFEIDRIPRQVFDCIEAKGIARDTVELCAAADRNREHLPSECYLFVTRDKLLILGGVMATAPQSTKEKLARKSGSVVFRELSWEKYDIRELHGFEVEELLSSGRLTARRGESDTPVFLAAFTNFCKDSMLAFAKYAERIAAGETPEVDPKDAPSYKCCPKCGLRYPDLNRRICPHCMEKGKTLRRFSVFLLRYRGYIFLTVLSLILMTGASILAPYFSSGFFYDEVIDRAGAFYGQILLVVGIVIGTRVLKMLATIVNNYVTSAIAAKMVFDLKKTIFGAIERLSISFFTGRQTGGLMTQINEDSNTIYEFFCNHVPYLIVGVAEVTILAVLLFLISPVLAGLSLITVPIFLFMMRWLFKRQKKLHQRRYGSSKRLSGFLADVFSGMRVVKAFSKEQAEIERFGYRTRNLAENDRKLVLFVNYARPLTYLTLYVGNVIAWGVGGYMVITGNFGGLTYGQLLTFIAYLNMIFSPLELFTQFVERLADCSNSMQRLFEIMDTEPDVAEKPNAVAPEDLDGRISFDRVSFSYQKGKRIINDVSFSIPDGHILGIVGHTGAGKSTIANLILRMYDVDEGEISIGGYPVRDLKLSSIYRHVAIVSQETYLFIGTILENIRYARPDATFEEVVEAAKCAGAHDFIMKFPDAYDTRIGAGYQSLSGGERQRVSIARAILKNPKILILDEATAAMDTQTERKIQEALSELIKGKTTIMIAHRLSTLRDADELLVIERGRVAERGTHRELLEKEDGVYKKLFTLQDEALRSAGIRE